MRPGVKLDHYTTLKEIFDWVNKAADDKEKVERLEMCIFKLPLITVILECYYEVEKPYLFTELAAMGRRLYRMANGTDDRAAQSFVKFASNIWMYSDKEGIAKIENRLSQINSLLEWTNESDSKLILDLIRQEEVEYLQEFGLVAYELYKSLNGVK